MKIVTTESLPTLADNKTSITRGSAANSQGAKFESAIVLAFANLTIGQNLICLCDIRKAKHLTALRWLPPVLHFPEPLKFTKGFLAHYDGLVPVLARWCCNSF